MSQRRAQAGILIGILSNPVVLLMILVALLILVVGLLGFFQGAISAATFGFWKPDFIGGFIGSATRTGALILTFVLIGFVGYKLVGTITSKQSINFSSLLVSAVMIVALYNVALTGKLYAISGSAQDKADTAALAAVDWSGVLTGIIIGSILTYFISKLFFKAKWRIWKFNI